MTGERAGEVLAILTAAFPELVLERESARLWTKLLSELDDGDIAEGVALGFARHAAEPPKIAEFRESYHIAEQRARDTRARSRGLPEAPAEIPEEALEWLRSHEILKSL